MTRFKSVEGQTLKKLNGWLTVFFLMQIPPAVVIAVLMGSDKFLKAAALYLVVVSQWALVASHFTAWIAGRVEVENED